MVTVTTPVVFMGSVDLINILHQVPIRFNVDGFVNVHDTVILSPPRMKIPLHPPLAKGGSSRKWRTIDVPPFEKGGRGDFTVDFI